MPSKVLTVEYDTLRHMSRDELCMLLAKLLAAEAIVRGLLANEPGPSAASPASSSASSSLPSQTGVGHK